MERKHTEHLKFMAMTKSRFRFTVMSIAYSSNEIESQILWI